MSGGGVAALPDQLRALGVFALLALAVVPSTARAAESFPVGRLIEGVACVRDPSQSYTLYLPSAYDPSRRWPLLLVFDPRGRSVLAAELFRAAAEEHGWILMSSNDTRSDGPMEPNIKAVNAMLGDAVGRFASEPARLYAAGFSGGAMLAWTVAHETRRLAGVISAGGRWLPEVLEKNVGWASFATVGTSDFNHGEMRRVDDLVAAQGAAHRLELFPGPHSWMPEPLARFAVEWMELAAMQRGLRLRDEAFIARMLAWDAGEARRLEAAGEALAAMRRWEAITRTFNGLTDVSEATARAAELAADPGVKRALKEERRCDGYEARSLDRVWRTFATVQAGETPMPAGRLAKELGVASLLRSRDDAGGCEALAAARALETIFAQASFYLPRELFAAGRHGDAASVLSVATTIHADRPAVWYNLACAHARSGRTEASLGALERAVAEGFSDREQLLTDPDLASLHDAPRFNRVVGSLAP